MHQLKTGTVIGATSFLIGVLAIGGTAYALISTNKEYNLIKQNKSLMRNKQVFTPFNHK